MCQSVGPCVYFVCVCVCNVKSSQKPCHLCQTCSKLYVLLHKIYSKVLLVLRCKGLTGLCPSYYQVKQHRGVGKKWKKGALCKIRGLGTLCQLRNESLWIKVLCRIFFNILLFQLLEDVIRLWLKIWLKNLRKLQIFIQFF